MIHIFDSTMVGAPVLSGIAGSLRSLLKACMTDEGFGGTAVQSIVVSSGIATVTFATLHPFKEATVALISGATLSSLNGKKKVIKATTYAITYAAPGVADGAATGTISSKLAGAGWTELYPGTTNLIALKPSVPESTGAVVRVDDTGTLNAFAVGYTSMDDINIGANRFAASGQGMYWFKSTAATTAARPWRIVADGSAFYLFLAPSNTSNSNGMFFGDIVAARGGDAFASLITGYGSSNSTDFGCVGKVDPVTVDLNLQGAHMPRNYTGIGAAVVVRKVSALASNNSAYSGGSGFSGTVVLSFPNGSDYSLRLAPVEIIETGCIRGRLPGILHCPQNTFGAFNDGEIVVGQGAFAGRKLLVVRVGSQAQSATSGCVFVDVTDEWRG